MVKQFYFTHKWDSIWYYHSDQRGSGSNGNEDVLPVPPNSRAWASPSDSLVSYPEHYLGEGVLLLFSDAVGVFYSPRWESGLVGSGQSYLSAEMQSAYSTALPPGV